jgi:hypothetical protein
VVALPTPTVDTAVRGSLAFREIMVLVVVVTQGNYDRQYDYQHKQQATDHKQTYEEATAMVTMVTVLMFFFF